MPVTNARPIRWARGRPDSTMRRPTSSIFTINATTPYTTAVITTATINRMTARDTKPSSMTSLSEITMISPDRMKSVRMAPAIVFSSWSTPIATAGSSPCSLVVREAVMDLLGTLEAEVGAAEHQDDLDEHRHELAEHQRCRQDEQDLVLERSLRDPLDDRQLPLGGQAMHVRGRDGGVVDDDTRRLHAGPTGGGADVVDRRRSQLRQRRHIVQQADETTSHDISSTWAESSARYPGQSAFPYRRN